MVDPEQWFCILRAVEAFADERPSLVLLVQPGSATRGRGESSSLRRSPGGVIGAPR
jgi:hypothetical protein